MLLLLLLMLTMAFAPRRHKVRSASATDLPGNAKCQTSWWLSSCRHYGPSFADINYLHWFAGSWTSNPRGDRQFVKCVQPIVTAAAAAAAATLSFFYPSIFRRSVQVMPGPHKVFQRKIFGDCFCDVWCRPDTLPVLQQTV